MFMSRLVEPETMCTVLFDCADSTSLHDFVSTLLPCLRCVLEGRAFRPSAYRGAYNRTKRLKHLPGH